MRLGGNSKPYALLWTDWQCRSTFGITDPEVGLHSQKNVGAIYERDKFLQISSLGNHFPKPRRLHSHILQARALGYAQQ